MSPYDKLLEEAHGRPFACIVGWPVEHSRSPALHGSAPSAGPQRRVASRLRMTPIWTSGTVAKRPLNGAAIGKPD